MPASDVVSFCSIVLIPYTVRSTPCQPEGSLGNTLRAMSSSLTSHELAPLLAPLTSLPGVGPRHATLLEKISGGRRVLDLLFTLPERIVDRRPLRSISQAENIAPGEILTARVRVLSISRAPRPGQPSIIRTADDTGAPDLPFFHTRNLPAPAIGAEMIGSG